MSTRQSTSPYALPFHTLTHNKQHDWASSYENKLPALELHHEQYALGCVGRRQQAFGAALGTRVKLHERLNRCTLPRINKSPPQPPYQPEAGLIGTTSATALAGHAEALFKPHYKFLLP